VPLGNAGASLSAAGHRAIDGTWKLRTVDIGPWGERRILRQHLGDVVVGSVDIAVFLEGGGGRVSVVGRDRGQGGRGSHTLVRTLYSQFRTCC